MRALVVGLGRMGGFHRKVLMDLGYAVTTVDPDPMAGADYTRVPPRNFDVVCIATPIRHLAERASEWRNFEGHLLVEKPMAVDAWEASLLAEWLGGQRVAVGYVERFNPQVVALCERLACVVSPKAGTFIRWNGRPCEDVKLDLRSHDVDLARFLNVGKPVYDTRDGVSVKRREITVQTATGSLKADLLAHTASPLHAQWHHFLSGGTDCATPDDAVNTLLALGRHGLDAGVSDRRLQVAAPGSHLL